MGAGIVVVVAMVLPFVNFMPRSHGTASWDAVVSYPLVTLWTGAPIAAALAVLEAARLQPRSSHAGRPSVRSLFVIFLRACGPIIVMLVIGYGISMALFITAASHITGGAPSPLLVLAAISMLLTAPLLGFLLGILIPVAFAFPLALLGGLLAVAVPQMNDTLPGLRHVAGFGIYDCCSLLSSVRPDSRAFLAPIALCLAVVAACFVVDNASNRIIRSVSFVAALLCGSSAFVVAAPVDKQPVVARPAEELSCSGEKPRLCVWPETKDIADFAERDQTVRRAINDAETAGFRVPSEIVESSEYREEDESVKDPPESIALSLWDTKWDDAASVLVDALLSRTECASSVQNIDARFAAGAWLMRHIGADPAVYLEEDMDDSELSKTAAAWLATQKCEG